MAPPLFFLSKALAFGGFSVLAEGHRARSGISPCLVDPIGRPSHPAPFLSRLSLNPDSRREPGLLFSGYGVLFDAADLMPSPVSTKGA
jgi:hypothetical protein